MSSTPLDHRLATYGTLAPGRSNHHQVMDLEGTWSTGVVRGHLSDDGWGADRGRVYPAFTPDPDGAEVAVHVLDSAGLPAHWDRLDAFEGTGYHRIPITVRTLRGEVEAYLYRRRDELPGPTDS